MSWRKRKNVLTCDTVERGRGGREFMAKTNDTKNRLIKKQNEKEA